MDLFALIWLYLGYAEIFLRWEIDVWSRCGISVSVHNSYWWSRSCLLYKSLFENRKYQGQEGSSLVSCIHCRLDPHYVGKHLVSFIFRCISHPQECLNKIQNGFDLLLYRLNPKCLNTIMLKRFIIMIIINQTSVRVKLYVVNYSNVKF